MCACPSLLFFVLFCFRVYTWEPFTYPLDECPYGGYKTPIRMNEYGYFTRTCSCSRLRALDQDFEDAHVDRYE